MASTPKKSSTISSSKTPSKMPLKTPSKTPSKEQKCLTLTEKVAALKLMESGTATKLVAAQYGIGLTQLHRLNKRKADVLEEYEKTSNPNVKRSCRRTGNEELNAVMWTWFQDASVRNINRSGPMIREQALIVAGQLGLTSFKASTGWLDSFIKRHSIKFKANSGERGDVNMEVVDSWKERLPNLISEYEPADIFNMDETGLFFRDSSKYSYVIPGEDCGGGKRSKERITIALCASMTGKKPFVFC